MPRRWQRFAVDEADEALDPGADAAVEVALLQIGHDDFSDDAIGDGVRDHALETVAYLYAQRPVILGDQQQGAVVDAFSAELPGFRDADAVLLDRFGLRGGDDEHRDLAALTRLECLQGLLQPALLGRGQGSRQIGDARLEGRDGRFGLCQANAQRTQQHGEQPAYSAVRCCCVGHVVPWAGISAGPASDRQSPPWAPLKFPSRFPP